ncbi:YqaJ viral recombinase family protein [Falsiroseomonas sp. CW058]|uniref:YqaJ viral recombinase family protein n=1 Tax=Falsiroseomonas sp. CW058 TaxID=3388664 RepID=UPI003D316BF2
MPFSPIVIRISHIHVLRRRMRGRRTTSPGEELHMTETGDLLGGLGLSVEQIARRRRGLGGSDANKIYSGNPEAILRLWREKRGEEEPEDLSGVLPVMMGSYTEPLNAAWYERSTGRRVIDRGVVLHSPAFEWMFATLDGLTTIEDAPDAVWEAKHVNAFSKMDEVVGRYMPQLHHNMHCAQRDRAVLSVFRGTQEHHIIDVRRDDWYLAQLIEAERDFWDAVASGRPPVTVTPTAPIEAVEAVRTIDMTGSNSWAVAAEAWVTHRPAATIFDRSQRDIKAMLEADVKVAFGHGIRATRRKNGAVVIEAFEGEA